ncbi:MAG: arginine--tRNA ligase [Ethanoligenens sp.]|uniref:arginine--tRNA ligase n=1 Tax=Ethanoligenens sp. TaxID=2099655 RepID=UPI0039E9D9EB
MQNLMYTATEEIRRVVMEALGRLVASEVLPAEPLPPFGVEVPADRSHGDFSANVAMVSARALKMPPRKIAEAVLSELSLMDTHFERAEVAGPGFLNFFLAPNWYTDILVAVQAEGADYAHTALGNGRKVMVEYVSANPTGPMHMGNARGGALGDCLAAVLEHAGYDVTREFYVNDAGNQIAKFAASLEARYFQIYKGEDAVSFPEDGYHGDDIKERAKEFAAQYGDRYLNAPEEERRKALAAFGIEHNVKKLHDDLLKYRIEYDVWFRESVLHEDGELADVIALMKAKGAAYEKDGALWYAATRFGEEKDEVLVRANGIPTYFAADIAYHRNKFEKRGFDRVVDVWGADHHGHVARLKGAMDAIGVGGDRLDVVLTQLVRLTRGGEVVRMSKRTGKAISLDDLLEDVPVDAARFFFNLREANSHLDFDLDLAVEQSSQNPVYYVQYAHARIWSILKNLAAENIHPRACTPEEFALLSSTEERELIRHLGLLPSEIDEAAKAYDPARITRYVLELATKFHKFYNAHYVRGEDEPLMQARLNLCLCVRDVLKHVLDMLKITAPQTM